MCRFFVTTFQNCTSVKISNVVSFFVFLFALFLNLTKKSIFINTNNSISVSSQVVTIGQPWYEYYSFYQIRGLPLHLQLFSSIYCQYLTLLRKVFSSWGIGDCRSRMFGTVISQALSIVCYKIMYITRPSD